MKIRWVMVLFPVLSVIVLSLLVKEHRRGQLHRKKQPDCHEQGIVHRCGEQAEASPGRFQSPGVEEAAGSSQPLAIAEFWADPHRAGI